MRCCCYSQLAPLIDYSSNCPLATHQILLPHRSSVASPWRATRRSATPSTHAFPWDRRRSRARSSRPPQKGTRPQTEQLAVRRGAVDQQHCADGEGRHRAQRLRRRRSWPGAGMGGAFARQNLRRRRLARGSARPRPSSLARRSARRRRCPPVAELARGGADLGASGWRGRGAALATGEAAAGGRGRRTGRGPEVEDVRDGKEEKNKPVCSITGG